MIIPQGLVDVILSETLTKEEKLEAIPRFGWPVIHLDGKFAGMVEEPAIAQEDAALIARCVEKGKYEVIATPAGPAINFTLTKGDLTE